MVSSSKIGLLPTTESIEALQTDDQVSMLDAIDRLRRIGLGNVAPLPQLVVTGDQSVGKSSVLEALTQIQFPTKENLCTRFATEISIRREVTESVSCKISPDKSRPEAEKKKLQAFSKSIKDFSELPVVIEEATQLMGLNDSKAFAKDVLSIIITGPSRPQLTLVDLPGLIHAANKDQTEADVALIKDLVTEYISEKRTIILAVVSAKNDYANQIILKMCREADPNGSRTLGIITKPDFLRAGSENEACWIQLAKNENIALQLGWHLMRNRGDEDHVLTSLERDTSEKAFFESGVYKNLPQNMKGVISLRQRLSLLLFNHLKRELPALKAELDKLHTDTTNSLNALGRSRGSLIEQKVYLSDLMTQAGAIVGNALDGVYQGEFFRHIDIKAAVDADNNICRLRATVQNANIRFATNIRRRGHKYTIPDGTTDTVNDGVATERGTQEVPAKSTVVPKVLSRAEAVTWVISILQRSRGKELPGIFSPSIISELFWIQSEGWEELASKHVHNIASMCRRFIDQVLAHCAAPDVKSRLSAKLVDPALKDTRQEAKQELSKIMADLKLHPITYNHYYTDTWQKLRQDRQVKQLMQHIETAGLTNPQPLPVTNNRAQAAVPDPKTYIERSALPQLFARTIQPNMDKHSAEEALDALQAYYQDKMKYFVDVVCIQIVERHILAVLPKMLLASRISRLSDKEVAQLAGEPAQVLELRAQLASKKELLEEGQAVFREALLEDY